MTFIYSFLQKRKMHENQYGIIMVIIAYILSVLMLALGSDVFYNIKSTAAGIKTEAAEETNEITKLNTKVLLDTEQKSKILPKELINPYNLKDGLIEGISTYKEGKIEDKKSVRTSIQDVVRASNGEETVWFLGSATDNVTFDSLMGQLDNLNTVQSFSVEMTSSNIVITVTKEEVKMLERIVEAEASGEDLIGKILIANVIFNRIADKEFPDTIEDVIFQKVDGDYQFSPVANHRYWSVKVSKETKKAVQKALKGVDYSKGALYFVARKHTSPANAIWFDRNLDRLFKHGGHEFYKNK